MPYLGILVRKNKKAFALLTGLIRVGLFCLQVGMGSGQEAPETEFKVTSNFLLVKSALGLRPNLLDDVNEVIQIVKLQRLNVDAC